MALFPALERNLDLNNRGALILVAHYQTPAQIRRAGRKRLATYLRNRGVQGADALARKALTAAKAPRLTLPAEDVAARIVALGSPQRCSLAQGEDLRSRWGASATFFRPPRGSNPR